jgi:hypothetical protein
MRIIYESSVQPRENSRRRRPRPLRLPWLQLTALAYIFTYLVLGIWLAEVDLTQAPPLWQLLAGIVPPLELIPTPLVAFVRALLLPRVWLHLVVPGLLGWWLADRTATSFLFRFFRFPRHADAAAFQRRLLRTGSSLARRLVGSFTFPAVALRLAVITLPFILGLLVLQSPALSFINVPFFGRAPYVLLFLSWWLATACYLVLAGITIELPGPLVTRENLEKLRREEPLLRVGGPGPLIIGHSNVALAEKNGRFSRILGPGRQRLHHYEYIRTLLDLHAHETSVIASGITRDGIELQAELTVTYRLSHDDAYFASPDPLHQVTTIERQRPTRERPYPFGEQAVKAAAYGETVGNEGRMTWQELPLAIARGRFAKALAQRRLDEIFNPDEESTPSLYCGSRPGARHAAYCVPWVFISAKYAWGLCKRPTRSPHKISTAGAPSGKSSAVSNLP